MRKRRTLEVTVPCFVATQSSMGHDRQYLKSIQEGDAMTLNARALLVAGALILVSAVGVIYVNTERAAATKQATMTSGYGAPAQITPVSIRK